MQDSHSLALRACIEFPSDGNTEPNMPNAYLAIDLGASSGRAVLGVLDGEPLTLQLVELHRFEHSGLPTPAGPIWNLGELWRNILCGLEAAACYCRSNSLQWVSVGVDTWGVDWALLGPSGELLSMPHCYRDPQNDDAYDMALDRLGGDQYLYSRTGIQLMSLNTIFQVFARYQAEPRLFEAAERLVFLPGLFHFWLSGEVATERTIASTSSLINVQSGIWDEVLLQKLGIPRHLFGEIVEPGTVLGSIRTEIAEMTHAPRKLQIVLPACHDTASAVAAIPAGDEPWMFMSSGTWTPLGAVLDKPDSSVDSWQSGFTNEAGFGGKIRYLRNVTGLWLIQELRRDHKFETGEDLDFGQLTKLAEKARPLRTLIDPEGSEFQQPGGIKKKIRDYAHATGQPEPDDMGALVRCCLESLAICYRNHIQQLESNLSRRFAAIHIVGGGARNDLLNRFVSNATQKRVIVGPVEASASGNILVQAWGTDNSLDIAEIVRCSTHIATVFPDAQDNGWLNCPVLDRFKK